ncbi:GGDEF domain-containing protein [Actinoplanes sp. NPDC051851]|uniref:GGDEF domain-containing protein n=1 Tax=Actinoplanes sp. NPDC051851 TaxID=3154753 RepID=UPI0034244CEF
MKSWVWLGYLLIGTVVTGVALGRGEPWGEWVACGVQISAGLGIVVGIRLFRPARAVFWWMLAGSTLGFAGATVANEVIHAEALGIVLLYAAFGLSTAALVQRVRECTPAGQSRPNVIDGLVVMVGILAGTWSLITGPVVGARWGQEGQITMIFAFALLDLIRIAAAIVLLLVGGARSPAHRLVVASTVIQFLGDVALAADTANDMNLPAAWRHGLWVIGSLLTTAAALHPGMARTELSDATKTVSRTRLGVFIVLAVLNPVLTGGTAVLGVGRPAPGGDGPAPGGMGGGMGGAPPDMTVSSTFNIFVVPTILSVAVSVLLVLRMGMLGTVAQNRAAELDALRSQLEHRATHDPLTGLGNRAALTEDLTRAMTRRHGERGWLMLVDLDGFKLVNDTLGHPVGDELLVALSDDFRAALPGGTVSRLGGDEFAVLLPDDGAPAAEYRAQVLLRVAALEHVLAGHPVKVSASVGLLHLDVVDSVSAALREADVALYAAKAAGRDRYRVFEPAIGEVATR